MEPINTYKKSWYDKNIGPHRIYQRKKHQEEKADHQPKLLVWMGDKTVEVGNKDNGY